VACVYVEITGKDGEKHFFTTDATSTYDPVEQAIKSWQMFWWLGTRRNRDCETRRSMWNISVRQVVAKQLERNCQIRVNAA
jgi:hypothetical protein